MPFESVRNFKSVRCSKQQDDKPLVISIISGTKNDGANSYHVSFSLSLSFIEQTFPVNDRDDRRRVDILFDQENNQGMLRTDQSGFVISIPDKAHRGYVKCLIPDFLKHIKAGTKFEPKILDIKPRTIVFEIPENLLTKSEVQPEKEVEPEHEVRQPINNRRVDRPFSLSLE